jgi:hypothetical protein
MASRKHLSSAGIMLCITGLVSAQGNIAWQRCLGGEAGDAGNSIEQTSDSGYVVVGITGSSTGDLAGLECSNDGWVVKLDVNGAIQWQRCIGGSSGDDMYNVRNASDNELLITGSSVSDDGDLPGNNGGGDLWVVRLDGDGLVEWSKNAGGSSSEVGHAVSETSDGGAIVAGRTQSQDGDVVGQHGSWDAWVLKFDDTGTIQWSLCLGGSSQEYAEACQQTDDGGYIIAGWTRSTDGDVTNNQGFSDYWVIKLDGNGDLQWQRTYGGEGGDYAYAMALTSDGGYVVAGSSNSDSGDVTDNHGAEDVWVVKLDADGDIEWQRSMGGTNNDIAHEIRACADGGYIVTSETSSSNGDVIGSNGSDDFWAVKLDQSGTPQWQACLGGTSDDQPEDGLMTMDGGYAAVGRTTSTNGDVTGQHGNGDIWVVKLDAATTGVAAAGHPRIRLSPNPSTGPLRVLIDNGSLPSYVRIHDAAGRTLMSRSAIVSAVLLVDLSEYGPGTYSVEVGFKDGDRSTSFVVKE